MALPSSGQLSISDILVEGGQSSTRANTTLKDLSTGVVFTINTSSPSYPNGSAPYSISEWYGYDHSASSTKYYWDLSNDIKWDNPSTLPLASTSEDFSISLWIRPQWAATDLNLTVFDLTPSGTTSTSNRFFLSYDYGLNRFVARYRSNAVNFDRQWNLHANNSATGTGTSSSNRWTGANRGNTNSDGFVHLFVSYDASQTNASNAFKIYWNAKELTTQIVNNNGSRSNMNLDELTFCGNDNNTGGSRIADYMYMNAWNVLLPSTSVTSMYNSGDPISAIDAGVEEGQLIFEDSSTAVPSVGQPDGANNYAFNSANGQNVVPL